MNSKGEIALTLTLIGLFISVVGLSVSVVSVQQQQSRSASADELFTYKSTLELRDENGNVIDWESGMTWNNGLGGATRSSGDIKMPDSSKARLIYDATKSPGVPANIQNAEAHVTIGLPDGWTILDASCENKKGKTCDNVRWGTRDGGTDDHTMYGFKIADGAEVLYWFKVRRPGGTPPTTPDPAQICKSVGQACTDDYPEACTTASGQAGTRTCHKVGTCTGVGNGTQCSWGAGSRCTTCEASGGGGSLSCSRPCIYSQGDKCYKGRCDANNPTCNDGIANANNGCRFAGNECGVPATQVRCSDGGPITSPSPSTPPAPDTLTVHVNYVGTLPKEYTEDIHFHLVISEHKPYTPLFRSGASVWKSGQSKASDTYVKKGLEKGKEYLISLEPGKKGDRTAYYDLTTAKIEGCTNLSHPYGDEVCLYTPGIGSNKVTYTVSPAFQPTPSVTLSPMPPETKTARIRTAIDFDCDGLEPRGDDIQKMHEYLKSHSLPKIDFKSMQNGQIIQTHYGTQMRLNTPETYPFARANFLLHRLDQGEYTIEISRVPEGFKFCGNRSVTLSSASSVSGEIEINIAPSDLIPPTPKPSGSPDRLGQIERKVLVVEYNVALSTEGNKSIYDYSASLNEDGAKPPVDEILSRTLNAINSASGIKYSIVGRRNITDLTKVMEIGNVAAYENDWKVCIFKDSAVCEKLKNTYSFSYAKLDNIFNICSRVNKGEIDEVWHIAMPGLSLGEDDMFGPRPFNINGNTYIHDACKRNVPTLSIDLTRQAEEAVHSYLHRFEATIAFVYGTERFNARDGSPWGDFIGYPKITNPGGYDKYLVNQPYGCGTVHVPPNAGIQYDYASQAQVQTYCESFQKYPELYKSSFFKPVGPFSSEMAFYEWFMYNAPRNKGIDSRGKQNNWWRYIAYPELAIQDSLSRASFSSDTNSDNIINAIDYSYMINNLGVDTHEDSRLVYDDINQDGQINGLDLNEMMEHYGESLPTVEPVHDAYWQ